MSLKKFKKNKRSIILMISSLGFVVICLFLIYIFYIKTDARLAKINDSEHLRSASVLESSSSDQKQLLDNPYNGWKIYKTITSSNLSFSYPPGWYFAPPKEVITNNSGGKYNSMTLYSVKPSVIDGGGAPVATNEFLCFNIEEYEGNWSFSPSLLQDVSSIEKFASKNGELEIVTYKGDQPMRSTMRLSQSPVSKYGREFIQLKNNYVAKISVQYNCLQNGERIKNPEADFSQQPEVQTAKLILKSISW